MTRVLVVGPPRSGTTWVGQVLGSAAGARLVHEPDNPDLGPLHSIPLAGYDWMPALAPRTSSPALEALWDVAFNGGWDGHTLGAATPRRQRSRLPDIEVYRMEAGVRAALPPPDHVVVKSVHCAFMLDWLAARYQPSVAVTLAHPLNLVSSWRSLGWTGETVRDHTILGAQLAGLGIASPDRDDVVATLAWAMCGLVLELLAAARRHEDWTIAYHEELCLDPLGGYEALFRSVRLPWDARVADAISERDRAENGAYSARRDTASQPARWRRLEAADLGTARRVVEQFRERSEAFARFLERMDPVIEAATVEARPPG